MFAINTYEEIEKNERQLNEKHIIVLLFVRPSLTAAKEIIEEFDYIHYNSGRYCSVYAVGYTNNNQECSFPDFKTVNGTEGNNWYYSNKAFVDFKNKLEKRLGWRYSGDIELLILQSNPEGKNILNFEHYLSVDVNYGIKHEYLESFPRFMESLIRSSKSEVETVDAMKKARRSRYKIKNIVCEAIGECKKIPGPLKKVIADPLFYRTSKSYAGENAN